MAEITLHISDYRLEALEKAMEAKGLGNVEDYLRDILIELFIETVPPREQLRIQQRMDEEYRQKAEIAEAPAPSETRKPEIERRTKTRPLRAEEIVFEDDALRFGNRLNFKFAPTPSLCEALGVSDDVWQPDALANVYVDFNLDTERPDDGLIAALTVDDQNSGTRDARYPLSKEELAVILPAMEAYCQKNLGMSLSEYTAQYKSEQTLDQERSSAFEKQRGRKKSPER